MEYGLVRHFVLNVPLRASTGVLVPAGGNLTPVFNVVGSEIDSLTGAVRVVADWVVVGLNADVIPAHAGNQAFFFTNSKAWPIMNVNPTQNF